MYVLHSGEVGTSATDSYKVFYEVKYLVEANNLTEAFSKVRRYIDSFNLTGNRLGKLQHTSHKLEFYPNITILGSTGEYDGFLVEDADPNPFESSILIPVKDVNAVHKSIEPHSDNSLVQVALEGGYGLKLIKDYIHIIL